jgi:glycogen synthase
MKKILMLVEKMGHNAVAEYSNKVSSLLADNGFEVHMVFFSGSDYVERYGNLYKHGISFVLHCNNLFNWAMMMNNELKRRSREIFDEHGFDIIHANDWLTAPTGVAMKKFTGKPLLVTIHST